MSAPNSSPPLALLAQKQQVLDRIAAQRLRLRERRERRSQSLVAARTARTGAGCVARSQSRSRIGAGHPADFPSDGVCATASHCRGWGCCCCRGGRAAPCRALGRRGDADADAPEALTAFGASSARSLDGTRRLVHQSRALVDQAGVDLHHIRSGANFLHGVGGTQNAAHADDGKSLAQLGA